MYVHTACLRKSGGGRASIDTKYSVSMALTIFWIGGGIIYIHFIPTHISMQSLPRKSLKIMIKSVIFNPPLLVLVAFMQSSSSNLLKKLSFVASSKFEYDGEDPRITRSRLQTFKF